MKKTVVISGSASLPRNITEHWVSFWRRHGYRVLDWPRPIAKKLLTKQWPGVHRHFYRSLARTALHFIANEDHRGEEGYIGVGTFAEIAFRAGKNLTSRNRARIILAKKPSPGSGFAEDIARWQRLGWLEFLKKRTRL